MLSLARPLARAEAPSVERLRDVPRYLWLVLLSAFLGWMFDAAGAAMALIYVVGLVAVWFGPETKGLALRDV
jgi:hypothetical protein